MMNHDATHCLDFDAFCPKHCYRAQLTAELNKEPWVNVYPVSWSHFYETSECPGKGNISKEWKKADEDRQWWYFTFSVRSKWWGYCKRFYGTYDEARKKMSDLYPRRNDTGGVNQSWEYEWVWQFSEEQVDFINRTRAGNRVEILKILEDDD